MIPRQLLLTTLVLFAVAIGMGVYFLRLQRRQDIIPEEPRVPRHVGPPQPSPTTQTATAWIAYDRDGTLRTQQIAVPEAADLQMQSEEILRALLKLYVSADSPHRMGGESELRSIYLGQGGVAAIDVNSAFAQEQTSGVLPEELTLASFAQTLVSNASGVTQVKFLVDGKERETLAGHADLAAAYDASQVSELARELEAK